MPAMPEDARFKADLYRREAEQLRRAAEVVRDEGLREQLRSIAQQYETIAKRIESQPEPRPASIFPACSPSERALFPFLTARPIPPRACSLVIAVEAAGAIVSSAPAGPPRHDVDDVRDHAVLPTRPLLGVGRCRGIIAWQGPTLTVLGPVWSEPVSAPRFPCSTGKYWDFCHFMPSRPAFGGSEG